MKIRKLLCAAAALCITLVAGMTVQAASEKEALKAYNDMLSKPTLSGVIRVQTNQHPG